MERIFHIIGWILPVLSLCWPANAQTQQSCPAPPSLTVPPGASMFLPQQEADLGDLMAERMVNQYQIIEDEELTSYLNRVASRLLAKLPPTGFQFQFFLYDEPEVNAFSIAGGRIYVSRKLVAFLRNEDELASLLGHEIGHIVTHQPAIDMTMLFQQVLGVSQVTSREDISNRYNQLLDNGARGTSAYQKIAHREEPNQYIADQVAVYSTAGAGYAPHSFVDFFDRFAQTRGKTGGFFSNLFGLTTPNEKRLREIQRFFAGLPATCAQSAAAAPVPEFQQWQKAVIAYSRLNRHETLPGLQSKRTLDPPLRGDITYLKFSSDGRYALAQDESSIFVLTRQPFAVLFRIDAPDSNPALFTPDSKDVVFSTRSLRVEDWSIADQNRVSVHEVVIQDGCVESLLSPDGKTLACLSDNLDLLVRNVETNEVVFTKKQFVPWTLGTFFYMLRANQGTSQDFSLAAMGYSPDGHYFAAAPDMFVVGSQAFNSISPVALDLTTRAPVSLHGSLYKMLAGIFTFIGPDRVIAVDPFSPKKSAILKFPSGETLDSLGFAGQQMAGPSQGDYVMLRAASLSKVAVVDLKNKKMMYELTHSAALDIYDNQLIEQGVNGNIGLINIATQKVESELTLPLSPLGSLRAGVISPDLRWLAVSGTTRGAVWDLSSMKRLFFTRGFHGAFFDEGAAMYADFPKYQQTERTIARADLSAGGMRESTKIDDNVWTKQFGPYLMSRKARSKDKPLSRDITLELGDARDGHTLWTRNFPKESPNISILPAENRVVLEWNATADTATDLIKSNDVLTKQYSAMKDHSGVFLVEVLEAGTGHVLGSVLVDTGKNSFRLLNGYAAGDALLIKDNRNRILIYSMASGGLKGTVFGRRAILSPKTDLLAVENEEARLQFYSFPQLEKRSLVGVSAPISVEQFSADGKHLFVLTSDQHAYVFDTAALSQSGPNRPNIELLSRP